MLHTTQNSCFAKFTQQISSVSAEQYQAGVKIQLNGLRIKKELTAEKSVAKENKQLLKNVKPQEVSSLVQTPRSDDGGLGNRLREQVQRFQPLEKEIRFARVCEDATFVRRVSIAMSYKTMPDVDDGFVDRTPSTQRLHTSSRRSKKTESMQRFQDKSQLDQLFKFISHDILTSAD